MDDYGATVADSVKKARELAAAGNYRGAAEKLLLAGELALRLAKRSAGAEREEYLAKYKLIKELLEGVRRKAGEKGAEKAAPSPKDPTPSPEKRPDPAPVRTPYKGDGLSPQRLSEYVGQPQAVKAVRDLIEAALLKNTALPHILLYGSHGLGKTTFARIIANEMHANFTEVNVNKITVPEMIAILKKVKPRDVIFIDEIHTLPLPVAESVLYSAMQDGKVTYNEGRGKFMRPQTLVLPPFTLIGATTELGKIAKPFVQRAIKVRLEEYSEEVLGGIIATSFSKLGMKISEADALFIARRCRNNPRVANSMVRRISDRALVRFAREHGLVKRGALGAEEARKLGVSVTRETIETFFTENGIDEYGLEEGDRKLLRILIERYAGGPVGLDTLARVMNESANVLAQEYEAYLIKRGFLKIDPAGRVVMPAGYKALGLPVPGEEKDGKDGEDGKEYEGPRRKVEAAPPDPERCGAAEKLIVYPAGALPRAEGLDDLFPDIEKDYEGKTAHANTLEVSFGGRTRVLPCDSYLERNFATHLAKIGYVQDIKAQTAELPYLSQAGSNRRYFPDFVLKDYKGRIAVVEMKNFAMASYHLNIEKYGELKRYCEENGYGYAEIMVGEDGKLLSLEDLIAAPVDRELEAHILSVIEARGKETGEGAFTRADFEEYVKTHKIGLSAVHTVLLHNRALKNIDRSGDDLNIVPA